MILPPPTPTLTSSGCAIKWLTPPPSKSVSRNIYERPLRIILVHPFLFWVKDDHWLFMFSLVICLGKRLSFSTLGWIIWMVWVHVYSHAQSWVEDGCFTGQSLNSFMNFDSDHTLESLVQNVETININRARFNNCQCSRPYTKH